MPIHILVGTRTLCGLDPVGGDGGWNSTVDAYTIHAEGVDPNAIGREATCTECREVFHRRAMNELGYSGLADDGPINIAPQRYDRVTPPEGDDLSQLWARAPELTGTPINLAEAQERIERLEASVEQIRAHLGIEPDKPEEPKGPPTAWERISGEDD